MTDSLFSSTETEPHPLDDQYQLLSLSILAKCPHVTVVALNRPSKRNAINRQLWVEIGDAFRRLGSLGDGCRCILLTGQGKAFSAGIDISDQSFFPQSAQGDDDDDDIAHRGMAFLPKVRAMQECFTALEACYVPVVAAIHGSCIGAGIDLACCCDVRLCAPGTVFSVREVRLGLAADIGTLQRLPTITGHDSRVRELCLTGENFDDHEALRIGFVSRVTHNLWSDAAALCTLISSNSPVAVVGTKRSLVYSRDHTVQEGLDHIASHNAMALMTKDLAASFVAAASRTHPIFEDLPPFSRL
jgi:Delta3,5-Delta2,4-dienoyl-CoA isomerase